MTIDASVKRIAALEAQIEKLSTELAEHKSVVRDYLGGDAIDTVARHVTEDGWIAELRPGTPSFVYDSLLAALGEHLSANDLNTMFPGDRTCSTCNGSGRVTGKVNAVKANQVATYKAKPGVDFAATIAKFKNRAPATLRIRRES